LILRKIIKFVAITCHILRLKCTRFNFGWGSAPYPAEGAYSTPPDRLAGFRGPTSKRKGRRAGRGEGEEREGEKGWTTAGMENPPQILSWLRASSVN